MKTLEQRIKALEQQAQSAVRFAPGGGAAAVARLTVGSGATIGQVSRYQFSYSPGAISASSTFTQTFTINGLALNDWVFVNPPGSANAPMAQAWVSAANTLSITFVNPTTVAQTPPTGTYTVIAVRA